MVSIWQVYIFVFNDWSVLYFVFIDWSVFGRGYIFVFIDWSVLYFVFIDWSVFVIYLPLLGRGVVSLKGVGLGDHVWPVLQGTDGRPLFGGKHVIPRYLLVRSDIEKSNQR